MQALLFALSIEQFLSKSSSTNGCNQSHETDRSIRSGPLHGEYGRAAQRGSYRKAWSSMFSESNPIAVKLVAYNCMSPDRDGMPNDLRLPHHIRASLCSPTIPPHFQPRQAMVSCRVVVLRRLYTRLLGRSAHRLSLGVSWNCHFAPRLPR